MSKVNSILMMMLFFITLFIQSTNSSGDQLSPRNIEKPTASIANKPLATPSAPTINAKAYILIDVNSGKIIAEKNSDEHLPPASLTKMMTLYVISNALHNQQIHLNDMVRVSRDAWKTGGSRMFI